MEMYPSREEIRAAIQKKQLEHVLQILDKPTISVEENNLLQSVQDHYAEMDKAFFDSLKEKEKEDKDSWWLLIMFFLAVFGFGGEK